MGEQNVNEAMDDRKLRSFMRAILEDLRAMEMMLDAGMFETGIRRIGAEQEMFLVDQSGRPAPIATDMLEVLKGDGRFTTELARFNLEANLQPRVFGAACLSEMEGELNEVVATARAAAGRCGSDLFLVGILPSIRLGDLHLENMTPNPRYFSLNRTLTQLRGGVFRTAIKGVDELSITHDNVMLEACNTSFQIHFQSGAEEFAKLYNAAQLVTAPVLAAAAFSPLLLGKRLWHETRIALFQQSVDARSTAHQARGQRTRVSFGDSWVKESILEMYREDVARFRVVLAIPIDENPLEMLERGEVPNLKALRLHNGTVYRWNRPCYGIVNGKPHLRIENRVLPAGPTVVDEIANAALYFGLMASVIEEYPGFTSRMPFDDAKANFISAARHGLDAHLTWVDGKAIAASDLILQELLPLARGGLLSRGIHSGDVDKYLGIVEERVRTRRTGARWFLQSLAGMGNQGNPDQRLRALVTAGVARQRQGAPVHSWEPAQLDEAGGWRASYRRVDQCMLTDIPTVRPNDLVDLAACLMDWERTRYIPVEDDQGRLVGLLTYRNLIKHLASGMGAKDSEPTPVHAIMTPHPVSVPPSLRTIDAIRLMRDKSISCLPVVEDGALVGLVTERELIQVARTLLEAHLLEEENQAPHAAQSSVEDDAVPTDVLLEPVVESTIA
jgi:CBS domain-containing protein